VIGDTCGPTRLAGVAIRVWPPGKTHTLYVANSASKTVSVLTSCG